MSHIRSYTCIKLNFKEGVIMPTPFVHLHLHTDYSLLGGACHVYHKEGYKPDIVKLAKEFNMPAVAITDLGFMGGVLEFYKHMTENCIKPIIGCEIHVSPTHYKDKNPKLKHIKGYQLLLLAKNIEGYRNLCKLNSLANLEGFFYNPRVDKELLRKYSKGLIALSGCLYGELGVNILSGDIKKAEIALTSYLDFFGNEDFYLELMDHGLEEEKVVNKAFVQMANKFGIKTVATNDVLFLNKKHHRSHELLLCLQSNRTINEYKRMNSYNDQFFFKTGDEMAKLFSENPEAISNTLAIADKCNLVLDFNSNRHPVYISESIESQKSQLRNICLGNLYEKYNFKYENPKEFSSDKKNIINRLDYELDVIDKNGFTNYFLILYDIANYAKKSKIPVGPGRGAAPSSIVAYLSGITNIDPIKYGLLFERFLNQSNIYHPCFYIDFCERDRDKVIEYILNKYGYDNAAHIATYMIFNSRQVLKDVGRALGYSFEKRYMVTTYMHSSTLRDNMDSNPELKELIKQNNWIEDIFLQAEPIENNIRNIDTHAAGIIIGNQALDNLVPLIRDSDGNVISQFTYSQCESLGLLTLDILGLRALTVIKDTLDFIKKNKGICIDINAIPLNDKKTYQLLNIGNTIAVFQFESEGMMDFSKEYEVERFEDISILIAMYRPGPMQFFKDLTGRKSGAIPIIYEHPKMENVLNETHGIILYQEQVIQLIHILAGLTLCEADIMRKVIGKRKPDEMAAQKENFIKGCAMNSQISNTLANEIWNKIKMFYVYTFMKSHSIAYGLITYQMAFLKANYPVEFMCSVLNSEKDNYGKLKSMLDHAKEIGINLTFPKTEILNKKFTTDGRSINLA